MIALDPRQAAIDAPAASITRPATRVILDTPDARLVVFRLQDGQAVPPHRSPSSVMLTVLHGNGMLDGQDGERFCGVGDVVAYEPGELHSMRATSGDLHLLATITPRPGERAVAPAALDGAS
jgi:quercetin dioxygenase-like cupin family protein